MFKKLQDYILGKVGLCFLHCTGSQSGNERDHLTSVSHAQGKNQPTDAPSPTFRHHSKGTFSKRVLQTPLLTDTPAGCGGVQGLGWFLARLLVDEDGDVADSFMVEDGNQHDMQHVDKVRPTTHHGLQRHCNTLTPTFTARGVQTAKGCRTVCRSW